jgi:asparagine synthase (glutamine-hydrolysing)
MCGIAGLVTRLPLAQASIQPMREGLRARLHHRGPDAFGVHAHARGLYANARLAIVDRAGGDQPIFTPDRRHGIVYNGEVYNWGELRQDLERRGHHAFATQTDTEAVLATVVAQGDAGLARLNGMFALCIWDERDHSLLLARDRFGAKPLYVYEDGQTLAFASELRALLALPGLDLTLDPVGFQDLLSYRHTLAPHTFFRRIRRLPAGHVLRWRDGRSQIRPYVEIVPQEPAMPRPEADYLEELDALLGKSVRSQLMGEVPVGVLLSGGLDSSAIAAGLHQAGARLAAYSIGFPEVNEFAYSREVARRFDLDYVEVTLTQDELRRDMMEVIGRMDEPLADPACFALSRLCRRIREDVTVVLSGEGSDELFAGYPQHQLALAPGVDRDTLFAHFFAQSANFADANRYLADKSLPLQHLRLRRWFDEADTPLNGMQALELHAWLPENLMMKADKVLMAHSLEGRFPFLDNDLADFALRLPQAMKLPRPGSSKHLLRTLMTDRLPRAVIERPKMGFTVPPQFFLHGLRERLLGAVETLRGQPVAAVLDLDELAALVDSHYRGAPVPVFKVWNVAVLLLWWAEVFPRVVGAPPALPPAAGGSGSLGSGEPAPSTSPPVTAEIAQTTAAAAARTRLVVYTVLVGSKEALADPLRLLPPGAGTDLDLDFVCLTDNPALRSDVWRVELIPGGHLPPEKLSRRPKTLPHEYFPDAAWSLYVDNTVAFKRLPCRSDLQPAGRAAGAPLFRAFLHPNRKDLREEATVIAMLGYDDVDVVCRQLDFVARTYPLESFHPLTTATVLLREHHHEHVRGVGQTWWETFLAFSKRDQLSLNFALRQWGVSVQPLAGDPDDNDFVHWESNPLQHRVSAAFDATRYAWLHRDDPAARRDPRGHFLAHGSGDDFVYRRASQLFEYVCHAQRSSLGHFVAPRRSVAPVLDNVFAPLARPGLRFLIAAVHGSPGPCAFSDEELAAGCNAVAMYFSPARGTRLDLTPAELDPASGGAYGTPAEPYELAVVLGCAAEQLAHAVARLLPLMRADMATVVAVLSTPIAPLQAAVLEQWLAAATGRVTISALNESRHDDLRIALANTVATFAWGLLPGAPDQGETA